METLPNAPETTASNVEVTADSPKPSYYRVLVSQRGDKLFRTSRLRTGVAALEVYNGILSGFVPSAGFTDGTIKVEVLEVLDDGSGHVMSDDDINDMASRLAAELG